VHALPGLFVSSLTVDHVYFQGFDTDRITFHSQTQKKQTKLIF